MAGDDHAIGPEAVEAFGAESQDAWERTLAFVAAHG